jgi:hypothetical protein
MLLCRVRGIRDVRERSGVAAGGRGQDAPRATGEGRFNHDAVNQPDAVGHLTHRVGSLDLLGRGGEG